MIVLNILTIDMSMTDLWPLSILTEIGYSLIGSPCWQNFLWLRGCTRMAPCCGTVLLYSPSPAYYAHSTSSLSLWRRHWLKGSTCDPGWWWRQRSVLAPLRITTSSFLLLEKKRTWFLLFYLRKKDCGLIEITGNVCFRHFPCLHQEIDWIFPCMFVYTVKIPSPWGEIQSPYVWHLQ